MMILVPQTYSQNNSKFVVFVVVNQFVGITNVY